MLVSLFDFCFQNSFSCLGLVCEEGSMSEVGKSMWERRGCVHCRVSGLGSSLKRIRISTLTPSMAPCRHDSTFHRGIRFSEFIMVSCFVIMASCLVMMVMHAMSLRVLTCQHIGGPAMYCASQHRTSWLAPLWKALSEGECQLAAAN